MSAAPDTWMAFYVGDYVANTLHLAREHHGSYLLLILAAFKNGGWLPDDDMRLAATAKVTLRQWKAEREIYAGFFQVDAGRWTHRRVTRELSRAQELTRKRQRAGRISAANRRQNANTCSAQAGDAVEQTAGPSQSESQSPSQSPSPSPSLSPLSADARASRATLIPEDWQPSAADLAALRQERPDVVGEVYERRLRDFRDWCRAKAVTSHDIASTWRSFMRRTDAPRQAPPWKAGQPAAEHRPTIRMGGPDGLWKMRLSGYRPGDPWKYEGDPPGGPNCRVPAELIPHWRAWLRELEAAS